METVIDLFKTECIRTTVFHHGPYRHMADVELATAGWVDWYNDRRLHSSLDNLTPEEFETAHDAALTRELQPVRAARNLGRFTRAFDFVSKQGITATPAARTCQSDLPQR